MAALTTDAPAVLAEGVVKRFEATVALAGVSLGIEEGTVFGLLGPNGAGKTTLLRILATALAPSFGRAEVDGLDVSRNPHLVRQRIAYLSHATGLYDDLTARENLAFAATMLGLEPEERTQRLATVLAEVGLDAVADRRVRTFSAGMRRRLALGRLILSGPSLILLDEPYAALDVEGMELIDRLLAAWREVGATVLVASHAVERLLAVVDGVLHLEAGVVSAVEGAGVSLEPIGVGAGQPVVAGAA